MNMIPNFPIFHKLNITHRESIEKITSKYLPYSDFNFTSMWTYNTDDSIEISLLNNNLVVRFVDYISLKPFYSFIGQNQVIETVETLLKQAEENCLEPYLKLIPEVVVNSHQSITENFIVEEDLDNHDYIISADEISLLHPEKYKRKHNLVEQFKNRYSGYQIKLIDLKEDKQKNEILDFFVLWEKINSKDRTETENELVAIKRLFDSIQNISVFTLGIYFENKMIGFNIYENVHENYAISAFQKGDKSFTGIYAMLSHEVAKHLVSIGCNHINYEQDLGIEGLRLSKSTWKPTHFLKKYIISPKKRK